MQRLLKLMFAIALSLVAAGPVFAQGKTPAPAGTAPGRTTPGLGTYYGGYGQTPWFNNPGIRQQLNLNNNQANQLGQAYGQAWNSYFGNSANNAGGQNNPNNILNQFNNQFEKAAHGILSPKQYERYQQLNWQYQGYGAFNNPAIQQKLNLTAQQRARLSKYHQQWEKNFNNLQKTYGTNPAAASKQYNTYRQEMNQNINSVLTPQQRQMWQQMTGNPYEFGLPFQSPNAGGTTSGQR